MYYGIIGGPALNTQMPWHIIKIHTRRLVVSLRTPTGQRLNWPTKRYSVRWPYSCWGSYLTPTYKLNFYEKAVDRGWVTWYKRRVEISIPFIPKTYCLDFPALRPVQLRVKPVFHVSSV